MSLLGHKRTKHRWPKSTVVRFGPKADKTERNWIVRFVPIATDAPQQTASLFDHLVGGDQQARRHVEAERPGGHVGEFGRATRRRGEVAAVRLPYDANLSRMEFSERTGGCHLILAIRPCCGGS
jgi:hypothetical protein